MGVFKTADGRSLVGIGQQDGNEYSGFAGWRDCVIQLTASGATEDSVKYLNAIKDYAIAHNAKGESIMPPNLSIWISNNGVTTAVQADDIAVDGANVTICGIKWNGTAWDYTDAGKGGGGSGGATSLNDLSDVHIYNPQKDQILVRDGSVFKNMTANLSVVGIPLPGQVADVTTWNRRVLMGMAGDTDKYAWVAFEELPLAYTLKIDDATFVSQFNALVANLKTAAKASGKAGLQIPFAGSNAVSHVRNQAIEGHMSLLRVGTDDASWQYYSLSSVDASHVSFHADHTDADGIYHITAAFTATFAMMSCEYTGCPAMS